MSAATLSVVIVAGALLLMVLALAGALAIEVGLAPLAAVLS